MFAFAASRIEPGKDLVMGIAGDKAHAQLKAGSLQKAH
jgi:hypothetical protein